MNGGYKTYAYDAFGNETASDADDTNPFRYCGEYYDRETGTYYLRARYYAPTIGRFTQQDTHWTNANRIYGDNPQKTNEREDRLGIQTYAYVPQISAVMQSGNLYVYCMNDPVMYSDRNGQSAELTLGWTSSMWWLPMCDGPLPIGDLVYFGGIVVTSIIDTVNIVGIDNIALYINELTNAVSQVSEEVKTVSNNVGQAVSGGASPGDPNWGKGFDNFTQLKRYLGSAGKDHEWHHIVEQCQIRKSGFDAKMIHNTENVISVPHDIHVKISAYYNSIDTQYSLTMRVRDYLATKSFAEQYEFGLKTLRDFGVIQ